MSPRRPKRAAIYARLSVTTEESVSIERQVESARRYCDARGWDVVLVATDDGVSATKRRPQDRDGWRQVLDADADFDVVVIWKIDRLARRVADFVAASDALDARGAALVAVEDPIDLSTAQGRAFAQILAVFGELEAASIGARVKGARAHLAREGRAVGARPWPFESVPNPDGPGLVWRPIPERAQAIREAVTDLVTRRTSLAQVARDWTERGFEPPQGGASWNPASVRRLLTSPALTGATPSGDDVIRNADGTVKRDKARQILTPAEHRAVLAHFAENARHSYASGARPIHLPLLYDLARCASCGSRLVANRPRDPKRPHRYLCQHRECSARVGIDLGALEAFVVEAFLERAAESPVEAWEGDDDPEALTDLTEALESVQAALVASEDDEETASLLERRKALRAAIRDAEDAAATSRRTVPGVSLLDLWESLADDASDDDRREVLAGAIESVIVRRTEVRRGSKVADRAAITWRS